METPRSLHYRLPAEWEPQEAVWLSWPINRETWPDCWESVQETFAEIALTLSGYQKVYVNLVATQQNEINQLLEKVAIDRGLNRGEIRFFDHPVDDVWVRDHGPIFLKHRQSGTLALSDWGYNGWGEKYPFELDNQVPELIAREFGYDRFEESMILEGGAIESNGEGDLLVTTNCLLNPNRNPGMTRGEIQMRLQEGLAVEKVHWLEGCIEGDDTDGHIDNLVRFYKPDGVLVASSENSNDPNREALENLTVQCRALKLANGKSMELQLLPLPEPRFHGGRRLPLSYLNFFIANEVIVMPAFGQKEADARALNILSDSFPHKKVIPINCQQLILEGGALHCLTQQVPQA